MSKKSFLFLLAVTFTKIVESHDLRIGRIFRIAMPMGQDKFLLHLAKNDEKRIFHPMTKQSMLACLSLVQGLIGDAQELFKQFIDIFATRWRRFGGSLMIYV